MAISITCSYPLIFGSARDGLLDLFKVQQCDDASLNKVTFGIMALVTLLVAKLTDLGLVASVGGATLGTALVFEIANKANERDDSGCPDWNFWSVYGRRRYCVLATRCGSITDVNGLLR